ncbi:MAG: ABC transporter ATP-binding protein [Planctomycetes bacterium]|nr:ABC transporter ATP-binding protein [Planctomycetota bacterium]MCC7396922.1 ABC transporter ATP-binding protein [Planctomycetota bacterium]
MLRIAGLRKSYGSFVALHGLDLTIAAGEILALLGPNGAGKSTTVKCLVGLLRPDAGSVTVDGIDAQRDPAAARRRIGYLPEVARLHEALTPWEFLLLKGRLFDLDDGTVRVRGERLLDGFGLSERGDQSMAGFSKGMLQKVSIAGALLTEPKLLVFDEPLSGLDVTSTLVVKELMHEFARRGGAVLHCSHLLDVVETTADRIAVLDRGQLLACGTSAELRTQVGASADTHLDHVFRSLVKASDPQAVARSILGDR